MSDLTPEALDRLAQLDADATPGPWIATRRGIESPPYSDVLTGGPVDCMAYCYGGSSTLEGDNFTADAVLIAAMRTHLPALLHAARDALAAQGYIGTVKELRAERDAARAERDRLARWKAEALPVMSGLQELGHALGIPLGGQITARGSVDLALDLRAERDAARAEVAALRERVEALRVTWTEATCQTDGAPCSWHRVSAECATELDAALADPATDKEADGG